MKGLFITFEGTEGCGKSTQITLLADRLHKLNYHDLIVLREPGGTPIGEEIRHTLKHSQQNHAMTSEAELLLMNASRAQLVREIIRPGLAAGKIILCDRFYDSTIAYQGYGRELDLPSVKSMVDFAVGGTRPNLTILLSVSIKVSEARRLARRQAMLIDLPASDKKTPPKLPFNEPWRDRMEEADRAFFKRVARGYETIATTEAARVKTINGAQPPEIVSASIWDHIQPLLPRAGRW